MWEHRAVSQKQFEESGRVSPSETYVQLMDKVEDAVKEASKMPFNHEEFLNYVPRKGPWEMVHATDNTKEDPRTRYIGQVFLSCSTPTWYWDQLGSSLRDSNSKEELARFLIF